MIVSLSYFLDDLRVFVLTLRSASEAVPSFYFGYGSGAIEKNICVSFKVYERFLINYNEECFLS